MWNPLESQRPRGGFPSTRETRHFLPPLEVCVGQHPTPFKLVRNCSYHPSNTPLPQHAKTKLVGLFPVFCTRGVNSNMGSPFAGRRWTLLSRAGRSQAGRFGQASCDAGVPCFFQPETCCLTSISRLAYWPNKAGQSFQGFRPRCVGPHPSCCIRIHFGFSSTPSKNSLLLTFGSRDDCKQRHDAQVRAGFFISL